MSKEEKIQEGKMFYLDDRRALLLESKSFIFSAVEYIQEPIIRSFYIRMDLLIVSLV